VVALHARLVYQALILDNPRCRATQAFIPQMVESADLLFTLRELSEKLRLGSVRRNALNKNFMPGLQVLALGSIRR
jgi:hypothetical protein